MTQGAGTGYGTIVAEHAGIGTTLTEDPIYAEILVALGQSPNGRAPGGGREFIVRQDNGQIISVMEDAPTPLAVGEHVAIVRGPGTRLVRIR